MESGKYSKGTKDDFFFLFLTSPKYRVLRHILLLTIFVGGVYNRNNGLAEPVNIYSKIFISVLLLSMFYTNMYILIPKLVLKGKYFTYFLWLLLLFAFALLLLSTGKHIVKPFINPERLAARHGINVFTFLFVYSTLMAASAAMKLFQRWIADGRRISELEKATILSELEQLKSQINPHFLLNTLNNANVLTKKDPEKASQVLMKLSDQLRYQLYDSALSKVLLTADIHFLEDFLNLEKIRRDNFEFIISKQDDISGVQVAPLLFITFAENAVKHNVDAEALSFVHLFFAVKNKELIFRCINSKPHAPVDDNKTGGLGLVNVKRRLELLYPNAHRLTIRNEKDTFTVDLTIKI